MQGSPPDWDAVRRRFPGAARGPYMDVAARSLLLEDSRLALEKHLEQLSEGVAEKPVLFEAVEHARRLYAKLIRATPDEIAMTRNVTDGIAAFAASLDWRAGDGIVLCQALEHPANILPWVGVARKFGLHLKNVDAVDGLLTVDAVLAAIEPSTRVVAVSAVTFAPGFSFPVAELGVECRRRGVLLVVDAAQSIGITDTDVGAWQVDALSASTQKGLMALYGQGFLYVRREFAETLKPIYLSRFGIDESGHEAAVGDAMSAPLAAGARRFDVGNYNYPGVIAVAPALDLLLGLGPTVVEQRVHHLSRSLVTRLLDAGLPVWGGAPGPHTSHIVTVGALLGTDHDSAAAGEMLALYDHLCAHGVRLSIRRDLLRLSLHLYNNEEDVAQVAAVAAAWVKTRAAR